MAEIVSPDGPQPHEELLESYEAAIRELHQLRDPQLADLLQRLERRQTELAQIRARLRA